MRSDGWPPSMRDSATNGVHAGKPRSKAADAVAKESEEEHARVEVIRKADEYREEARKRAVFLQENPPSDEWEEPPRYELS